MHPEPGNILRTAITSPVLPMPQIPTPAIGASVTARAITSQQRISTNLLSRTTRTYTQAVRLPAASNILDHGPCSESRPWVDRLSPSGHECSKSGHLGAL